jgi:hypothetical protein
MNRDLPEASRDASLTAHSLRARLPRSGRCSIFSTDAGEYAESLQAVEQRIVVALPEIIDGLFGRANDGDTKAAVYLCDRILGNVAAAKVAPADNREAVSLMPPSSLTNKTGKMTTR